MRQICQLQWSLISHLRSLAWSKRECKGKALTAIREPIHQKVNLLKKPAVFSLLAGRSFGVGGLDFFLSGSNRSYQCHAIVLSRLFWTSKSVLKLDMVDLVRVARLPWPSFS